MTTTGRVVCRTLGIVAGVALVPAASAVVVIAILAVTTVSRMERDNFFSGGRFVHDRGRGRAQVGYGRRWLSRSRELDDQRRFGRVIGGRPGHVAIACRPSDD